MTLKRITTAGLLLAGLTCLPLVGCGKPDANAARQINRQAKAKSSSQNPSGPDYAATLAGVRAAYDVILTNLANAQTPGYRAVRPRFRETGPDAMDGGGNLRPVMEADPTPGNPVLTGRWLDVAIEGTGYFILDDPVSRGHDGLAYTRSGRLFINPYNELVYGGPDGPRVEPIVIFPDEYRDLRISREGRIDVLPMTGHEWVPVGQLHLARFANNQGLATAMTGRFTSTGESGPPQVDTPGSFGLGQLKQKHLEGSNVDVAAELAELEHLKDWGKSLAAALDVDPGFDAAPPIAYPQTTSVDSGLGPALSAGR